MQRNTLWPIVCVIGGKIFPIESQWVCLREPQPLLPFVLNRTPCQHSSQRKRFCFFIIRHLHQQSLLVAITIYVLKFWWINSPVSVCGKKKNIFFFWHVPRKTLAHFYTLLSEGLSYFSLCLNVCNGLCVCVFVHACSSELSLFRKCMHAHTAEMVEINGCQCQHIWPEAAEIWFCWFIQQNWELDVNCTQLR